VADFGRRFSIDPIGGDITHCRGRSSVNSTGKSSAPSAALKAGMSGLAAFNSPASPSDLAVSRWQTQTV
jgi:hypothetical protein